MAARRIPWSVEIRCDSSERVVATKTRWMRKRDATNRAGKKENKEMRRKERGEAGRELSGGK
jgi:hypothetical protein